MARQTWHDADFMSETRAASVRGPRRAATLLLLLIAYLIALGLYWAHTTIVDEVTRADGKVIPSSQVQVVQNLEGGILSDVLIDEGDVVEVDQVLLRIDNTTFQTNFQESQDRRLALLAGIGRLKAEVEGIEPDFAVELTRTRPDLVAQETALLTARQREFDSAIAILVRQVAQKEQERRELSSKLAQARESYRLAFEELKITRPLVQRGVMSRVELLRLERQVNDLKGDLDQARLAIPRVDSAINEAKLRIDEKRDSFRTEALTELNERRNELTGLESNLLAAEDRVLRTAVRSPVRGTVKRLKIRTIGGVIKPGEDLVEIVPLEDRLLIEARVRPSDIAFLYPGQPATVRITAYDFSIYGGLDATVEQISADAISDENGDSFFQIRLRTQRNALGKESAPLPIIPGMTAIVDILTGEKSVLDYLLKPILKVRDGALRER